jgi:hypothetical protein
MKKINNHNHKDDVIDGITNGVPSDQNEAMEMKFLDGRIFLSADDLITFFETNAKRQTLSNSERRATLKSRDAIIAYKKLGLSRIPEIELKEIIRSGDVVEYIGGQDSLSQVNNPLVYEKPYKVVAAMDGLFNGTTKPALMLDIEKSKGVMFLASMFRKIVVPQATSDEQGAEGSALDAPVLKSIRPPLNAERELMDIYNIKFDGRFFNHPATNSYEDIGSVINELKEYVPPVAKEDDQLPTANRPDDTRVTGIEGSIEKDDK